MSIEIAWWFKFNERFEHFIQSSSSAWCSEIKSDPHQRYKLSKIQNYIEKFIIDKLKS